VGRRVIVTGGAGFLGSHLVDSLLADGRDVVCVDNLLTGDEANLEEAREDAGFTFVDHDVTDPFYMGEDVDDVFHLASPASPDDYLNRPIHTLKVGALGTYHMLGLAKEHDARFLLASTSEVYGDPEVNPQPESYKGNVSPTGPRGVYDEGKRYAEAIAMAYHREHGVESRIARIFNTYGPRMRPEDGRAIPTFVRQALQGEPITVYGDGEQTRSFCYVDDLVAGMRALVERGDAEPVNIGRPEEITINELAERIRELVGSDSEIVHEPLPEDDPQVRRPDISRAKEVLDWEPEIPLGEGLKRTLDAVGGDPEWTGGA
jgi:dTDP-glucose 4,6-dehydratase